MSRNHALHTPAAQVEANIVAHMRLHKCGRNSPLLASTIGEVGFQGYRFGSRQGAALAVAKILRGMLDRGVLRHAPGGHGYCLAEIKS